MKNENGNFLVMEGPTAGGPAFMRNVARLVALYVRTHPEMNQALQQRELLHRQYLRYHVRNSGQTTDCNCTLHYMTYCPECKLLNDVRMKWECNHCHKWFCVKNCSKDRKVCVNGCCFTCGSCKEKHDNAGIRRYECADPSCNGYPCTLKSMLQCSTCQKRVCETHKRFCGYCGVHLCGPCADNVGHVDCERRKRFKPSAPEADE